MLQIVRPHFGGAVRPNKSEVMELPRVFCWTKMGTEAGQSLEDILRRKELERQAGDGIFAWGIGNSLGTAPTEARGASTTGQVEVLFTPMKSAAKAIDSAPDELLLWTSFIAPGNKLMDLPAHALVTSRGGSGKRAHYALLCSSDCAINDGRDYGILDAARARNLLSLNPVGASQVTAVVQYDRANGKRGRVEKPYKIAVRAKLTGEGFVRLANPIVLTGALLDLYRETCKATTVSEWQEGAYSVRNIAEQLLNKCAQSQGRLFG